MQTFLPYSNYVKSARCLDNKRLGKQRVECKQILLALGAAVGDHVPRNSSWRNHPAVKMWYGYEIELCDYSAAMCVEWIYRGFKDTLHAQFVATRQVILNADIARAHRRGQTYITPKRPWWLGREELHASHRSNLLRKDAKHYGRFGWLEPPDLEYYWPVRKYAHE